MAETNLLVWLWRLVVVHPAQAIVAVNFSVDVGGRFSHPGSCELPVVSCVQRSRIKNQHRHFGCAAPVIESGLKLVRFMVRGDLELVKIGGFLPPAALEKISCS